MELIVLADSNWGIGYKGEQIVYIPGDLRFFREKTMGHPVILGRKTMATFPGGRPLKGRRNLILSRDPDFAPPGAEVFRDLTGLLAAAPEDSFVIGGASVYQALLPFCSAAYVTRILKAFPADRHFPDLDALPEWEVSQAGPVQEEKGLRFQYRTYLRKK